MDSDTSPIASGLITAGPIEKGLSAVTAFDRKYENQTSKIETSNAGDDRGCQKNRPEHREDARVNGHGEDFVEAFFEPGGGRFGDLFKIY